MSVNNTSCSPSGTCVIIQTGTTNGTNFVAQYNPDAPVVIWRQNLELITICVCNSLTLILIVTRLWYRWTRLKRFRGDDRWMAVAGFFLIGYFASQIGTNRYGSGLHFVNIPEYWRKMHWQYSNGWAGYWLVTSCIKLSVCFCFLEILGGLKKSLTYLVYGLCVLIGSLGVTMAVSWVFQCTPFLSNFIWAIDSTSCVNYDIFRGMWIGLSIIIDGVIMYIPFQILKLARLRKHEERILEMVFCATLLGTITCIIGIYGSYEIRTADGNDAYYKEVAFVMMNDIEILMYALGATFLVSDSYCFWGNDTDDRPVFSRFLIQRAGISAERDEHRNFSSWARYVPDFFLTELPRNRADGSTTQHSRSHPLQPENGKYKECLDSIMGMPVDSPTPGSSECGRDLEKGVVSSIACGKESKRTTDESTLMEYIESTRIV